MSAPTVTPEFVKAMARDRWREILPWTCGIDSGLLDGKHHPCPKCGGRDRFRFLDATEGALFCNQCFSRKNGDGLAAISWYTGCSFKEAVECVATYLRIGGGKAVVPSQSLLERVAAAKQNRVEDYLAFGAEEATRQFGDREEEVIRFPAYGPDGKRRSYFDLNDRSAFLLKGAAAPIKGYVGLFWERQPKAGERVLLTEGLKDAAALRELGYLAVGMPTCYLDASYANIFCGCDVVIVPDRDEAGDKGAIRTRAALEGVARSIRVAVLPGEHREKDGDGVREAVRRHGADAVRRSIDNAGEASGDEGPIVTTLHKAVREFIAEMRAGGIEVIPTGIESIDRSIGGFCRGEMIVIGARPGQGKTMLAMQWLDNMALRGRPCLMVSEEMSITAVGRRSLQYLSEREQASWMHQTDEITEEVECHFGKRAPIFVAENCRSVQRAVGVMEEYVAKHGVECIAIDYLQFLRGEGRGRYEQVTFISQELSRAAKRLDVIMVALCQLNRPERTKPTADFDERIAAAAPSMSDLRESGQIEQDASVILLIQWPTKTWPDFPDPHVFILHAVKNRNRPIHQIKIPMYADADRMRLLEIEEEPDDFDRLGYFDNGGF